MAPWSRFRKNEAKVAVAQSGIKNKILKSLTESVTELQYQYQGQYDPIPSNEVANRLCTALEAIFSHGLKETFLGRLSSRLSDGGVSSPRMPEPTFWTFALVFSHKEVISHIEGLTQISSDVGRGRTWLRQALNDGLLVSYLTAMIADRVSLAVHYEKFAFLRDPEKRDLCLNYLTGVSVFSFSLSTNVSTLNRWQTRPLVLAGWWRDSNVEVDLGADVAADLQDDPVETNASDFARTLAEPIRDNAGLGYMRRGLLNEDEALRLILQSTPVAFSPQTKSFLGFGEEDTIAEEDIADNDGLQLANKIDDDKKVEVNLDDSAVVEEVEEEQSIYSYKPKEGEDIEINVLGEEERATSTSPERMRSPSPELMMSRSQTVSPALEWDNPEMKLDHVFDPVSSPCLAEEMREALSSTELETCVNDDHRSLTPVRNQSSGHLSPDSRCLSPCSDSSILSLIETRSPVPRLNLVLRESVLDNSGPDLISEQNVRQKRLAGMGFSSTPGVRVPSLSLAQNICMTQCLDLICHEAGLDAQDWRCQDCSKSVGALFGAPRVCMFTRKYYCETCHNNLDVSVIPARLLYNWDATLYKVAKSSMIFLQSVSTKPIININTFSPNLSKVAPVIDIAQRLRKQLIYLSAYLSACSKANQEGIKVTLAEIVWPREYLYTETEMYSINDVNQLHSGELITTLTAAVKLCIDHVARCLICSGRGFICEICRDKKPVYPFNLDSTSQCRDCHTVFHSNCSRDLVNCPKCERIEARNLNWHVNNSKLTRELGGEHD